MLHIRATGSAQDSIITHMAIMDSTTAISTYSGISWEIRSLVSLIKTEKPARKQFLLHRDRTCSMDFIVASEAPGWSYWTIIMVASPEKKMSRMSAGIISWGIWMPTILDSQMALLTPGTCSTSFWSWLVYSGGISSTISMVVAAMWKGSSSRASPLAESRSSGR